MQLLTKVLSASFPLHKIGIGVLLALLSSSCTFEPDDFYENINPVSDVQIQGHQFTSYRLNDQPDTFRIYGRTNEFTYQLDINKPVDVHVILSVDGVERGRFSGDDISFSLEAANYEDGYHALSLQTVTSSGTGSLADSLKAEFLVWEPQVWTFYLKREAPAPISFTSVGAENGYLVLKWDAGDVLTEKQINFTLDRNYSSPIEWSYHIKDPQQTQLADSFYVGGKVSIEITNQSIDPSHPSPNDTWEGSYSLPKISSYESDGHGNLTVRWTSPFYENVQGYQLKYDEQLIGSAPGSVTSLTDRSIPFWTGKVVKLHTKAKHLRDGYYGDTLTFRQTSTVRQGVSIGRMWFNSFVHAPLMPDRGFAVDRYSDKFYVLDKDVATHTIKTETYVRPVQERIAISNYGGYLYFGFSGSVYRMDRQGEIIEVLNTENVYGSLLRINNLSIGGDRYLSFNDYVPVLGNPTHTYVYDLNEGKPLFDVIDPDRHYGRKSYNLQSSDGKHLIIVAPDDIQIFTNVDETVSHSKTLELSDVSVFFDRHKAHELIIADFPHIHQYNIDTEELSTVKIENLSSALLIPIAYDIITGLLGATYHGHYNVIDPKSGEVLRQIPIDHYTARKFLYNGHIYAESSKYDLKLQP